MVGDGVLLPNLGEKCLNLEADHGEQFQTTFQIARVTRPLMSAGLICDKGYVIIMDKEKAIVKAPDGVEVCRCRRNNGGALCSKAEA